MADVWKAPGADKTKVIYRIVQYIGGEWAIERSEVKAIAWFPDKHMAADVVRALLPLDAERDI